MALALGMDAFSMCLGLGLVRMGARRMAAIGLCNGFLHMAMPLAGMILGQMIGDMIGHLALTIGGTLLICFGLHMVYSSLFSAATTPLWLNTTGTGLFLFSVSVSLDSFSVGLSLGLFDVNTWLAIPLFGFSGLVLTWLGLILGRYVGGWMGHYSEAVGGMILVTFGLKFLF
ncbi:manganese efflux pump MntP [Caldalkalibacillus uzonensis]|nr:manganese efflux pump MntP family protein [Caldalkalibacillus uzonensis]